MAQTARDDDSEPRGYFIGECGHREPIREDGRVGDCRICDPGRPAVPGLRLPASELYRLHATGSAGVSWWCLLCDRDATTASAPAADTAAVEHLVAQHGAAVATTSVLATSPAGHLGGGDQAAQSGG